jgi:hypothetical protein
MLTQDRLKAILDYNPDTGKFQWRQRRGSAGAGRIAGCDDGQGYIQILINSRVYAAHRLAWLWIHGRWPHPEIDHKNGVRNDNRLTNLREATRSQNHANRKSNPNRAGLKGVERREDRWSSYIRVKGRSIRLGTFDTPEEAHNAYLAAARRAYGEFARGE